MIKPRVYLDTSVPSALLDARAPERQALTKAFWRDRAGAYELAVSEVVEREIASVPDRGRRQELLGLIAPFKSLPITDEAEELAATYIAEGLFPPRYLSDALHLALAVTSGTPILASWNFTHLVRRRTRQIANLINLRAGYHQIEITTPAEL